MKFQIRHEIRGRMRIHVIQSRMSFAQADTLQYYLEQCESVISAKIQNRTEDVTICYEGSRDAILEVLKAFSYEKTDVPDTYIKNSGREMISITGISWWSRRSGISVTNCFCRFPFVQ